jgi:hypothetical protein
MKGHANLDQLLYLLILILFIVVLLRLLGVTIG